MRPLTAAAYRLARVLHILSGFLLVAMILVVLLDVASRSLFGASGGELDVTFPGGVELVSFGLLFMVLFALPYSVDRGQVIVDLFTERMPERAKAVLSAVYTLGFALLGFAMAIRFYEAIGGALASGETSQDLIIPLYYIYALAAFATAALGLRALLVALRGIFGGGEEA